MFNGLSLTNATNLVPRSSTLSQNVLKYARVLVQAIYGYIGDPVRAWMVECLSDILSMSGVISASTIL